MLPCCISCRITILGFAVCDSRETICFPNVLLRSSKFNMGQSRKRLYLVMVRKDVCPNKDQVENLSQVITKVLPSTLTTGWRNVWDLGFIGRETLPEIRKYTAKVLEEMQREPTFPEVAQDSLKADIVFLPCN